MVYGKIEKYVNDMKKSVKSMNVDCRGVYLDHYVDFGLDVSYRFKIESCVHVGFYIIDSLYLISNRIQLHGRVNFR